MSSEAADIIIKNPIIKKHTTKQNCYLQCLRNDLPQNTASNDVDLCSNLQNIFTFCRYSVLLYMGE